MPDYHIETINFGQELPPSPPLGNLGGFRLRYLPGGRFTMGSDESEDTLIFKASPPHPVELSPFYIAEYPVTQALWMAVMGEENNPSRFIGLDRPVEKISWDDIVGKKGDDTAFLPRLNARTKATRPAGFHYALPTEAQWEYAARGGEDLIYAGSDKLKEVAWFDENSHGETKPIGLKRPNAFGLYDLSGNVREWCRDWAGGAYYEECLEVGVVRDPQGPPGGSLRVLRGGSWFHTPRYCRVACRGDGDSTVRVGVVGFRVVLAPVPAENR